MTRLSLTRRIVVCMFAVFCLYPGARTLAQGHPADWVPSDSALLIAVPNCNQLIEAYKNTLSYQSTQDPALQDALKDTKNAWNRLSKELAKILKLESPKELEIMPDGGMAMFGTIASFSPDGSADDPIGFIVEFGSKAEDAERLVRKVVQISLEEGGERETSEFAGTEITTITLPPAEPEDEFDEEMTQEEFERMMEEEADEGPSTPTIGPEMIIETLVDQILEGDIRPEKYSFAWMDSKLIVGSSSTAIEQALQPLKRGRDHALSSTSAFRSLRKHVDEKGHIQMILNLPQIWKSMQEDEDFGDMALAVMDALNFDSLGAIVASASLAPAEDVEMVFKSYMEIGAERSGIPAVLLMKNQDVAPAPTISEQAAAYYAINLDPDNSFEQILNAVTKVYPEETDQFRQSMKVEREDGTTFDIRKDLVSQLQPPLSFVLTLTPPYDSKNINMLMSIGHRSREAIEKLMALGESGQMFQKRELRGAAVYESPMMQGMAMGITAQEWIVIATKTALEAHIRRATSEGQGLRADPNFRAVAKRVPRESSVVLYVDGAKMYEAALGIRKSGDFEDQQDPMMMMGPDFLTNIMRRALVQSTLPGVLENPEVMRKYQTVGILTVSSQPDGIQVDAVSIKPVQAR